MVTNDDQIKRKFLKNYNNKKSEKEEKINFKSFQKIS